MLITDKIKELKIEIHLETCRLQLLDYPNENSYNYLNNLKKQVKEFSII